MSGREFEAIVWGAAGCAGRLVAERLLQTYGPTRQPRRRLGFTFTVED
jgi:short subunit dehydrogenase-like uncharacterized protein